MQLNKLNNNYFRLFGAVYPPLILALIFIPFIVGLFINPSLSDSRELVISLIWLPFFTIPYSLSNRKVFYYLIAIFCFINGFVNLTHWIMIKGPVSASSLFVFFTTNYQESIGFIDLKRNYYFLLLIPYLIVFIYALRFPAKVVTVKYKEYFLILIGLISFIFVFENAYNQRLIRKGVPVLIKSSISFYDEIKAYKKLVRNKGKLSMNFKAIAPLIPNKQVFVLIIGESANRNHMSLYGYSKQTTPKLQKINDIVVYDNVVSAYSLTLNSVLSSMSQANLENKLAYTECISLIDVFRMAGFKTYWLSNQSPIGIWDNLITLFAQTADETQFVNVSSNSSFETTYTPSYDDKLFLVLNKCLNEKEQRKFIVLHLMGSHSTYAKRYPSNFRVFKDESSDRNKIISEYDNSTYYNDYIVDSLLKIIRLYSKNTNSVAATIYLSDHGENVYDEFNYVGHDYAQNMSKNNMEIPFIVWLSPQYKKIFNEKSEMISGNNHKPFVTDDLFHSVIDLMNIKTSLLDNKRSVFNKDFNDKRKRILVDGKDYDNKKRPSTP